MTRTPQLFANREAIRRGYHYVQDHQIVGVDRYLIQCIFSCGRYIHRVGMLAETFCHKVRDPCVVFDQ